MDRVHYEVDGIINNNMKTALKNALENIDGVQMVNVDLGNQTVEVGYNENTDHVSVKRCIEKSGVTINSYTK
ncbi:MAG: heavy-metal-associated domain-containing protein [Oscillospiraceae bacterium]|nr:heavy-metal-associated domain-containing protein [Oscillospiraceae bacterium]